MRDEETKPYAWYSLLLALLFLAGCATPLSSPTDIRQANLELPEQFSEPGVHPPRNAWWQSFGDEHLNQLVQKSLAGNLGLKASFQRLQQAKAVADRQSAGLFPTLDATAGAERQESDASDDNLFRAGLTASYEIDLWGRVQALSEAEALRAAASMADYQAAGVSLSGEITSTWFQLIEQRAQLELAETQLDTNQNVLKVIESRFATGQGGSTDVLRQRQLVIASRERVSNIQGDITLLENQLSVLLGQAPGGESLPDRNTLPALPPLPDTGIPAELLQRRPDLQRAFLQVQAADQDLAAAISNRFPRLSIEASVTAQSDDTSDLFDNWLATLAGNLVAPIVDGGQRRAEVRRSEAAMAELVQQYGQTALTAIQEVEDALAREQQQQRRLQSLEKQRQLADTTYLQLRTQYLNGGVSYIEVLTALQDRQDLQRTILTARQQLLTARVGLYRALAGPIQVDYRENTEA
jgi:NodT family efflux transporter outer membrane factor (OMF) lipoprotein